MTPDGTTSTPTPGCTGLSAEELAVLVHELRGALTVISGYSSLLGLDLPASDRAEAIDGIERAVQRADGLLGDALAAGRANRATSSVTQLALIAEQVASEQRAATKREIRTELLAAPTVRGESGALARAITNLISNAAKYSPAGTPIEITVSEVDGSGVIEVADRGPGIPAEERAAVFEPFTRLSRDAEAPGSGLGLTVVRRVAEAAGGTADVEDRHGGGTVVRLVLPLV